MPVPMQVSQNAKDTELRALLPAHNSLCPFVFGLMRHHL